MDHRELKMSEKEPHYQGGQDWGLTPGHLSVEAVRMNKEGMPGGQGAALCATAPCVGISLPFLSHLSQRSKHLHKPKPSLCGL